MLRIMPNRLRIKARCYHYIVYGGYYYSKEGVKDCEPTGFLLAQSCSSLMLFHHVSLVQVLVNSIMLYKLLQVMFTRYCATRQM